MPEGRGFHAAISMNEDSRSPGGYVVVSFTGDSDGWCTLTRCPMGTVDWFPTREAGRKYMDTLPDGFEPHILSVHRPLTFIPTSTPREAAESRLYERAEDAAALDIPLEEALQTVRNGYSSIEADRMMREDP